MAYSQFIGMFFLRQMHLLSSSVFLQIMIAKNLICIRINTVVLRFISMYIAFNPSFVLYYYLLPPLEKLVMVCSGTYTVKIVLVMLKKKQIQHWLYKLQYKLPWKNLRQKTV